MAKPWTYVDGVKIATARKIAHFAFGEFYDSVVKNDPNGTFDIYLKEGFDTGMVNWFKECWGPGYTIWELKTTDGESIPEEA